MTDELSKQRDFMLGELAAEVRGMHDARAQERAEFREVVGDLGERVDALSDSARALSSQHQATMDAARESTKASRELAGVVSAFRLDLQRNAAATESRFVALESLAASAERERAALGKDVRVLMDERAARINVESDRNDRRTRFWERVRNAALLIGIPTAIGGAVFAIDKMVERFGDATVVVDEDDGVGENDDARPSVAGW